MKEAIKTWLINNGFDDEFLCNYQEVGGKPEGGTVSQVIEGCMADIGPKWVSVSDELPDEDAMYLITNGTDCDTCLFEVGGFKGFTTPFISWATHWMKLPKAPD